MGGSPIIRFIHEGKAAYPDVVAFRSFFDGVYQTIECGPDDVPTNGDSEPSVCWHIMGFYPRKLACSLTIHDYRSLSVGRMRRLKDGAKRVLNADPDIRIFQNDEIRRALGFAEDARTYYLPMGVPPRFIASRAPVAEPGSDFVYIGSMLAERRCELMLDSFVRRFGNARSFDLYGQPNPELEARYAGQGNIRFHGLIAQDRLPTILNAARVGVCYFPLHYPHLLQTPTKLMEYGALGMRILANEHPQSRLTAAQYGLHCHWGETQDLFAGVPDTLDWADNRSIDAAPMAWPAVIAASGVPEAVERALGPGARVAPV